MIELIYTTESAAKAYGAEGPQYSTDGAAAFDLRAMVDEAICILPSEQVMIPTGIRLNMNSWDFFMHGEYRMSAVVIPRSGRGSKEGLILGNTVCLIDSDYQGEVMICAWARPTSGHMNTANHRQGGTPIHIEPGERIAQMMFVPVIRPAFKVVGEFSDKTVRGDGGFGSTGAA